MNLVALFTRQADGSLSSSPLRVLQGTSLHGINTIYFLDSPKACRYVSGLIDIGEPFINITDDEGNFDLYASIEEMDVMVDDGLDFRLSLFDFDNSAEQFVFADNTTFEL